MASEIRVNREVRRALAQAGAVVALGSTIVSDEIPFPLNLETAIRVEAIVRKHNAVPATMAILDGIPHVGLSQSQLRRFAELGKQVKMCARRDLSYFFAHRLNGATTIGTTMYLAHQVGISVLVSGGIDGIHREYEQALNVFDDLNELGRTPVPIAGSGVKSVLDSARSLEYLEIQRVPVVAFGTKQNAAFFAANNGVDAPIVIDNPVQIADKIYANEKLGLTSGIVVGVPVPNGHTEAVGIDTHALNEDNTRNIVEQADVKPFCLQQTNGVRSLQADIVIQNNAKFGALIAASLSRLRSVKRQATSSFCISAAQCVASASEAFSSVVIVGGLSMDITASPCAEIVAGTSNLGQVSLQAGGVGRNIAECVARLGVSVKFFSAVGNDAPGHELVAELQRLGVDTSGIVVCKDKRTAAYVAVHGGRLAAGDLQFGIADFNICSELSNVAVRNAVLRSLSRDKRQMLVIDTNLDAQALSFFLQAKPENVSIWVEPISIEKSCRLASLSNLQAIDFLSPNEDELVAMGVALLARRASSTRTMASVVAAVTAFHSFKCVSQRVSCLRRHAVALLSGGVGNILLTRGKGGVTWARLDAGRLAWSQVPAVAVDDVDVVNTNGAGDCFVGGCVAALLAGSNTMSAVRVGVAVAALTVRSSEAVSPYTHPSSLQAASTSKL